MEKKSGKENKAPRKRDGTPGRKDRKTEREDRKPEKERGKPGEERRKPGIESRKPGKEGMKFGQEDRKTGKKGKKPEIEDKKSGEGEKNLPETELVYGKNPVKELLRSGKPVNKVLFSGDSAKSDNKEIISILQERGIPYQFVDRQVLDSLTNRERHQGLVAYLSAREYVKVDDILVLAAQRREQPFILMLDELEDPHNLGALLRTADAVGVHGVIIPKRRSVALTGTVAKTSAGAVEHVPVARVSNLVQTLQELKKQGCWVSGAEAGGKEAYEADLTGPRVLVIGGEGRGLGRLLRENCDELVSLPMKGKVGSLNAGVAGSVLLYEILRQRRNPG